MSELEQTLNESTEEIVEQEPSTSEETTEQTEELVAEAQTEGGTETEESGEDDPDEPRIPRTRLNEVIQEREIYKQQAEYYKQLLSNPQTSQNQTDDSQFLAPGEVLLPEKTEDEFIDELDYIRYNNERAQQQYRITTAKQNATTQQQAMFEAQQKAITDFTNEVAALAKSDNVILTEEDIAAIGSNGEILAIGYMQKGAKIDCAMLAKQAYALAKPNLEAAKAKALTDAKGKVAEQVRGQKSAVSAGRVNSAGGGSVAGERKFASAQEAMEDAYRQAYGEA